ncbi:MAG TPA: hypothetical protein VF069_15110 [Streptosporangiaceae bacterium]
MGDTTATRRVHETFAELICADPDLLDAEFEALVAAAYGAPPGWPSPPAPPFVPPLDAPGDHPAGPAGPVAARSRGLPPVAGTAERRQRSPPPAHVTPARGPDDSEWTRPGRDAPIPAGHDSPPAQDTLATSLLTPLGPS